MVQQSTQPPPAPIYARFPDGPERALRLDSSDKLLAEARDRSDRFYEQTLVALEQLEGGGSTAQAQQPAAPIYARFPDGPGRALRLDSSDKLLAEARDRSDRFYEQTLVALEQLERDGYTAQAR
jgi:hypothetical protein